eukprot:3713363-Pyramimonas_sp.AAC.1
MASKMAQDNARSLKMSSTMPPKGLKRATRHKTLECALADPSGPPREAKTQDLEQTQENVIMFASLAVSLPMRFCSLKMA